MCACVPCWPGVSFPAAEFSTVPEQPSPLASQASNCRSGFKPAKDVQWHLLFCTRGLALSPVRNQLSIVNSVIKAKGNP